jgi:LAO/AO transport system kinase
VAAFLARGVTVAVLAVDPSSPFSGGALLGDRIRMQGHATEPGVFIRSMGSRGRLGGLSAATPQAIRVLQAAGYQVILVETVGVGQAEVQIASTARDEVTALALGRLAGRLAVPDGLAARVADGELGPHEAAEELLAAAGILKTS